MSELISNVMFLACLFICVVLAVAVGFRVRSVNKPDQEKSEYPSERSDAPIMQAGDWANAVVNVFVGVLFGVVIDGLVELISSGLWLVSLLIAVLAAGFFFLASWFDALFEKIFPSGIRPARKPKTISEVPLARRLSLPVGIVLGVVLAGLGLNAQLLGTL